MNKSAKKTASRVRRHARVRARVTGTAVRPRLAVFRSNRYVYAQLINDESGVTIAASDSRKVTGKTTTLRATEVGRKVAQDAKKLGLTHIVFDRGGFPYQGIIAALADGARAEGLQF